MNNKIIAAGVVVALCAVALIGVGYAYTAEVKSENNAFGSDYVTVRVGETTSTIWSSKNFNYNTETQYVTNAETHVTSISMKYTSLATTVSGNNSIEIRKTAGVTDTSVSVVVSMNVKDLDSGYKELFVNGSNKASLTLNSVGADKTETIAVSETDTTVKEVVWTFNSVAFSGNSITLPVGLTCLADAIITIPITDIASMSPGPSVNGISMTITVGPAISSS